MIVPLLIIDLRAGLLLVLGIFTLIFLYKKEWLIYAIIITLFFEGYAFSFYLFGTRIRTVQIVEIITLFNLLIAIVLGKTKLKKTPLDFPLAAFILVNFVALVNAPSFSHGLKVAVLLLSLALLYYVIVNSITKRKLFDKAFNLLLCIGLVEILYGLYQVLAGICNYYLNINLPVGHESIIHREFIASPWGRPYGTFVEPDWYGAISMFYSLLFIALYFSRLNERKKFYLFGMIISILGMFLSFVRASWVGFLMGLFLLAIFGHKIKLSKIRLHFYVKIVSFMILIMLILLILSPPIRIIISKRFTAEGSAGISTTNARFIQISHSLKLFSYHPILGNGPGSFAFLGIYGDSEDYYQDLVEKGELSIERRYDPSILTTVLADTGIIGTFIFFLISFMYFKHNIKVIPLISNRYQVISFGLFAGIIGLFISYIYTHGFWIPFTWVFLGFNICALRLGLTKTKEKKNQNNESINAK